MQYANNVVKADHGPLKARLGPMRWLKQIRSARTIATGHPIRAEPTAPHYELTTQVPLHDRVRVAFDELALSL